MDAQYFSLPQMPSPTPRVELLFNLVATRLQRECRCPACGERRLALFQAYDQFTSTMFRLEYGCGHAELWRLHGLLRPW